MQLIRECRPTDSAFYPAFPSRICVSMGGFAVAPTSSFVAAHDGPRKSGLRISGHDGRVILDRVFLAVLTA